MIIHTHWVEIDGPLGIPERIPQVEQLRATIQGIHKIELVDDHGDTCTVNVTGTDAAISELSQLYVTD